MFEYAWRPFFLNNAKDPGAKPLFAKILTLFTGGASVVLVVLTFTIQDLIRIPLPFRNKSFIIGAQYWDGVVIVPIVLFAYLFLGIYTNLIAGVYIEKKTRYLPLITGLGAALNITSAFLLIPVWGIVGGAISTLVSYVAMAAYIYVVSQKFYPVKYEMGKISAILGVNVFALAVFFGTYNHLDLIYKVLLMVILCGIIIYISGLTQAKRLFKRS